MAAELLVGPSKPVKILLGLGLTMVEVARMGTVWQEIWRGENPGRLPERLEQAPPCPWNSKEEFLRRAEEAGEALVKFLESRP